MKLYAVEPRFKHLLTPSSSPSQPTEGITRAGCLSVIYNSAGFVADLMVELRSLSEHKDVPSAYVFNANAHLCLTLMQSLFDSIACTVHTYDPSPNHRGHVYFLDYSFQRDDIKQLQVSELDIATRQCIDNKFTSFALNHFRQNS